MEEKIALRVCSQETESMAGTCFYGRASFTFSVRKQTSNPVSQLRNYKLHFSSQILKFEVSTGKKRKKKKTTPRQGERGHAYIHGINKRTKQKTQWDTTQPGGKRSGGKHRYTLKLIYVHALAHVLSGRLLFLPLHSAILPQS